MRRFDQRQGFLVSAVLHLALLMVLMAHPPTPRRVEPLADVPLLERKDVVFLPPPAVLRQLLPAPPRSVATPAPMPRALPTPPPPPAAKKDRISVGPPTDLRTKGPLILRREDDLTKVPKGQMVPPAGLPKPESGESAVARSSGATETPGHPGLRMPPGLSGTLRRGDEGSRRKPGSLEDSIASAVAGVTRRMERDAELGLPTGTGHNMGGLMFDPQGADFTVWVNRFKNEVYRNWIVPEAALFGYRGHVDFEFTVERDGTVSSLRMLKSSGTTSLDRAAQNALSSSRLLPLPEDYGPPRITMQVTFVYNEAPQGS